MDENLSSKLELFVSLRHLPKLDTMSKSDPFVVVSIKDTQSNRFQEIGRTEVIVDNHDPDFVKQFIVDYFFEENQVLRFDVYDLDDPKGSLSAQDFIGSSDVILGDLVAAPGQKLQTRVRKTSAKFVKGHDGKATTLTARCEEVAGIHDTVMFDLRGVKLAKMDWFGKSDPYLEFFRSREDNSWQAVYKTEVIPNNLNPNWKRFTVRTQLLCNGDLDRPIWVKCWDWNSNGTPDLCGEFQASLRDMTEQRRFPLVKVKNRGTKKQSKTYGEIEINDCRVQKNYSFLDYIAGGCEVSLMVAVDFTASNGHPADSRSLHYRSAGHMNEYQKAIRAIGETLAPYDTDQSYPVWGFGGKLKGGVSHCFALTMDEMSPEVHGVQGMLDCYERAFDHVKLSGPTLFSQILQTANAIASRPFAAHSQHYSILLILTDGVINDMQKTIDSVVTGSELPLSIVIVGVGGADFSAMEHLDADDNPLRSMTTGKIAKRDIVQFVPFREFSKGHYSRLAKETLAEIPGQFVGFMNSRGVKPMDKRPYIEHQASLSMTSQASTQFGDLSLQGNQPVQYQQQAGGGRNMTSPSFRAPAMAAMAFARPTAAANQAPFATAPPAFHSSPQKPQPGMASAQPSAPPAFDSTPPPSY